MIDSLFWIVWNPRGDNPQVKHDTMTDAQCEAIRLAKHNPGENFYVLEARGRAMKPTDDIFEWYM